MVRAVDQAGAVHVFYGSSTGLSTTNDHVIDRCTTGMDRDPEAGGGFGRSLAAGGFNDEGVDDIAIGVIHDSAGSIGEVHAVYMSNTPTPASSRQWAQGSTDVQVDDCFGDSMPAPRNRAPSCL